MSDHKTEIVVASIALVGVSITAIFSNWDKIFVRENKRTDSEIQTIHSPSRTCKYISGPKGGTIQYFSPEEFPIINPAMIGQSCTDGAGSWGVAIKDMQDKK
jgi:hypothetical protein